MEHDEYESVERRQDEQATESSNDDAATESPQDFRFDDWALI